MDLVGTLNNVFDCLYGPIVREDIQKNASRHQLQPFIQAIAKPRVEMNPC
jgi:hypothetical protein